MQTAKVMAMTEDVQENTTEDATAAAEIEETDTNSADSKFLPKFFNRRSKFNKKKRSGGGSVSDIN